MEKTKEQKQASRERYLAQEAKATEMLRADTLFDFIDGLRYSYSLSLRYKKNLAKLIGYATSTEESASANLKRCLKAGILTPWNSTYYFDREKAESLQQYILEHPTN